MSPFDHPWLGGLFADGDAATIWSPDRQAANMLAFEAAFTRALGAAGRVPIATADTVAAEIENVTLDLNDLRAGTARDGLPVPALVAQLKKAVSDETAVHSGATSQDVMDTALSLTCRDFNDLLDTRLTGLLAALDRTAVTYETHTLMGRTRMQAALPITVPDRLATWSMPLERHRNRLQAQRPRIEALQLGGAVGNLGALGDTGADIAAHMAAALGLGNQAKATHAMRDIVVDYANLLSMISGSLGKMGQDICLMAQQGIDEMSMDGGGGSSAMPHKQNPILAELLVTLARYNATQISGMHHALVHEQERSGAAWTLEWMILPQMAQATARGLAVATDICGRITRLGH